MLLDDAYSAWSTPALDFVKSLCPWAPMLTRLTLRSEDTVRAHGLARGARDRFLKQIRPILSVGTLEDVQIAFPQKELIMTSKDLMLIMSSWPRIRIVRFAFDARRDASDDGVAPSLASLGRISWTCPQLTHIVVPAWSTPHYSAFTWCRPSPTCPLVQAQAPILVIPYGIDPNATVWAMGAHFKNLNIHTRATLYAPVHYSVMTVRHQFI